MQLQLFIARHCYEVICFQYLMEKSVRLISLSIKMVDLFVSIKITVKVHQILRRK